MKGVMVIILLFLVSWTGTSVVIKDIDVIDKQQKWGITLYERGEYKGAFKELSELAA